MNKILEALRVAERTLDDHQLVRIVSELRQDIEQAPDIEERLRRSRNAVSMCEFWEIDLGLEA